MKLLMFGEKNLIEKLENNINKLVGKKVKNNPLSLPTSTSPSPPLHLGISNSHPHRISIYYVY